MHLAELIDANWSAYEKKRFLNDDTKQKTENFDPESFKHVGFENEERYREEFVPALAEEVRIRNELTNFTPPRLSSINNSPYQAQVIRFGILRELIRQPAYQMEKEALLSAVQQWQTRLIEEYEEDDFEETDELLHLSMAAVSHGSDIDDSELNLIFRYCELHNQAMEWKHQYYNWEAVFKRLSSIGRFPKVSRSDSPEHALDTIEKGLWSLQEQALVYEILAEDGSKVVGIPEDYVDVIAEWLPYEMAEENYLTMVNTLEQFDRQSVLIDAKESFNITAKNHGRNEKRRENIVQKGIFPSDLFDVVLTKDDLKDIIDEFNLDAHKRKTDEMIEATIEYFEQSQRRVDASEPEADLYLEFFTDISDGQIEKIPPRLQRIVDEPEKSKKLEILFEQATAEIFSEVFNLEGTELLGQQATGTVPDGEIKQDGKWLLWDNKRRSGEFKLGSTTRSKIKDYIETKSKQYDVQWFLIIAPAFAESAKEDARLMEKQLDGVDIRLVRADDFKALAEFWENSFGETNNTLPLSMFNGTSILDVDTLTKALQQEFS